LTKINSGFDYNHYKGLGKQGFLKGMKNPYHENSIPEYD
jgi:hypothetical protein